MCSRLAPHQLDFDWRFTENTAAELGKLLSGTRILLLGCPTVAEALGSGAGDATLVDRQPAVTCRFAGRVVQADIRDTNHSLSEKAFDTILLDSPWYPQDLRLWLDFALSLSEPGTRILFSIWPDRTRPLAYEESGAIIAELSERGETDRRSDKLRYLTPGFEHNSMPNMGPEWRFGDLGSLVVRDPVPLYVNRPKLVPRWHRFAFGDYQVALRTDGSSAPWSVPKISPVFSSWYIPTVSKRQPQLDDVEIWTSNNEVGRLSVLDNFYNALHAAALGEEDMLTGSDRAALTELLDHGFVPPLAGTRRLEWTQYD